MTAASPSPWTWRDRLREEISLPREPQRRALQDALGHELAAEVTSPEDVPSAPIAAMDGFAVRRADLAEGTVTLPVSLELPARAGAVAALPAGTAARIMTGAPVPSGADAVLEVELTGSDPFGLAPREISLALERPPDPRRHIREVGEEIRRGQCLARPGDRVAAGLVGLAGTLGLTSLPVVRPLRVCVVVTGDELHGTGATAAPGSVRESNGAMLAAALRGDGAEARSLHSGDSHDRLRAVLEEAAEGSDLVLTTGGIGHGAYDVVKILLGERGTGTSRFVHLSLRPGGPQGAGRLSDGTAVIHLPGTPVGALVGYHLFVRPLLVGERAAPRRVLCAGWPAGARRARPGAVHALPGLLGRDADGRERVEVLPGRRLAPFGRADALVLREVAAEAEGDPADDGSVLVLPL